MLLDISAHSALLVSGSPSLPTRRTPRIGEKLNKTLQEGPEQDERSAQGFLAPAGVLWPGPPEEACLRARKALWPANTAQTPGFWRSSMFGGGNQEGAATAVPLGVPPSRITRRSSPMRKTTMMNSSATRADVRNRR